MGNWVISCCCFCAGRQNYTHNGELQIEYTRYINVENFVNKHQVISDSEKLQLSSWYVFGHTLYTGCFSADCYTAGRVLITQSE